MSDTQAAVDVPTKNIGELSELYAIAHILGKPRIPVVDGKLRKIPNAYVEVQEVLRHDDGKLVSYTIDKQCANGPKVDFGSSRASVSCADFERAAKSLLGILDKKSKGGSKIKVDAPEVVKVLELLDTKRVSAKASDKSDFIAKVISNGMTQTWGFSIKSQLGSQSTLINASRDSSYFEYEIRRAGGLPLSVANRDEIRDASEEPTKRGYEFVQKILNLGYELRYKDCPKKLCYTLRMLDTSGPEIIGRLLVEEARRRAKGDGVLTIAQLVENMAYASAFDSLGENTDERTLSLGYKVRSVLLAFMSGATPGVRWDGRARAAGGLIIVTKEGEVVCLQLSTTDAIGDYLMNSCRIDAPSATRHDWGYPYEDEKGNVFVRMQLQVRFKD